jgi:hypothetical protein
MTTEELLREAKAEIAELKLLLKLAEGASVRAREYNRLLIEEAQRLMKDAGT